MEHLGYRSARSAISNGVRFVPAKDRGRSSGLKGVGCCGISLIVSCVRPAVSRMNLAIVSRHYPALLCPRTPLHQHSKIQLFRGQPFECILTNTPKLALVHIFKEALFEVRRRLPFRIVVPEHALDVAAGLLADDVEYGVIVQGIAISWSFEQPLENTAFDGIRGNEIEDQTILMLAIAVNAPHALFQPVRVPGNVIVEEDIAALQVNAFTRSLRRDKYLDGSIPELLLGVQSGSRLLSGARFHAAMDEPYPKTPCFQTIDQVIEGVLEFSEKQESLLGMVEEAFTMKQIFQAGQLCLCATPFNALGHGRKAVEFLDLLPHLVGVTRQSDGFEDSSSRSRSISSISSSSSGVGMSGGACFVSSCARLSPSLNLLALFSKERRMAKVLEARSPGRGT